MRGLRWGSGMLPGERENDRNRNVERATITDYDVSSRGLINRRSREQAQLPGPRRQRGGSTGRCEHKRRYDRARASAADSGWGRGSTSEGEDGGG
jgi:hypothetical protein